MSLCRQSQMGDRLLRGEELLPQGKVLMVVRKSPPIQLLDSLAAVLENQVCSAVGEDLHAFVHA